jgi:hypothetical protein
MNYDDVIAAKVKTIADSGFEPAPFTAPLFDWQQLIVAWAIRKGRAALFEDCGLGKTIQQLEWAQQVSEKTGGPVLILCPLAVAGQTIAEGQRFGIAVNLCRQPEDVRPGINITNYEKLHLFDCSVFSGVVLDESSILKSFDGKMRHLITASFAQTPHRLACTATPSPNDFTELGQHAEFLGVCKTSEMLATYFINDTADTGTWRLKGHAKEAFWKWVSSWAACISKPSDLGFSDEGFDLPPVNLKTVTVEVDHRPANGELFADTRVSATGLFAENRRTIKARCQAAADIANGLDEQCIIWCSSNEESNELCLLVPDAIEVTGSDKPEHKERKLMLFSTGQKRVIVTKSSIAGMGLNWQQCRNDIYVGLTHSFERYYQSGKRIHRFGQKRQVNRWLIETSSENGVLTAILRKQSQHAEMRELMRFTADNLTATNKKFTIMNTDIKARIEPNWTLHHGDCVRVAKTISDESIGFSIFSPPFADLFTYSNDVQDMGNCSSLDEFMVQFDFLVAELARVMMPGREVAVHCCDLMATKWKDGAIELKDFSGVLVQAFRKHGFLFHSRITVWKSPVVEMQRTKAHGLLYKTLCKDAASSRVGAPDYLLVFRKRGVNPVPIKNDPSTFSLDRWQEIASPVWMTVDQTRVLNGKTARESDDERHICPLQLDIIERALFLWSAPKDLVFSPFTGIGSEGWCALKMGRRFVGAELKESYWKKACSNLEIVERDAMNQFNFAAA